MAQRVADLHGGPLGVEAPSATAALPLSEADPVKVGRAAQLRGLVRAARPRQWIKNLLVFVAPAAAGVLTEPTQLGRTLVAFAAFCLAASSTYFVNDARDAEADRHHPTKRMRPIAAGVISVRTAYISGILLAFAALAVAAPINHGELAALVAAYLALTMSYTLWLKHEPILDLGAVATGFVLRAVAGGIATSVPISDWFLVVAGGASLFIVTGKRFAEQIELGSESASHRATLGEYSTSFLRYVTAVASGLTIMAYCLWAFARSTGVGDPLGYRISILPFILGILRYAQLIEQGRGGAPEELALNDRVLQVLGVLWAVSFALGVYA